MKNQIPFLFHLFQILQSKMLTLILLTSFSLKVFARPEYALKTTTVSCNTCHLNPFGGGARNVFGKAYGSFGKKLAPFSKQDLFSADFRAIAYLPQTEKVKTGGFSLMNVVATLNAPLSQPESDSNEEVIKSNLVINFNDQNALNSEKFIIIEPTQNLQFILGQFSKPFGLLTDEHRTYVRMQTKTSIRDLHSGIGMAHEIWDTFHLDLTYGTDTSFGNEPTWGKVFNLRWTPYILPIILGISTSHHDRPRNPDSYAQSFYGGYSIDRASHFKVPVTFTFEASRAKGWNPNSSVIDSFFYNSGSDSDFKNTIARKDSFGLFYQILWNIKPNFAILYKYDQLALDENYPADAFKRHGLGFNWNLNSNLLFQLRTETGDVGRKDLSKEAKASLDTLSFVIRAWM